MGQITGKTYGFGRVSPVARPSQFAPTRGPGAHGEVSPARRAPVVMRDRRSARVRIAAVSAIIAVALVFAILAVLSMAQKASDTPPSRAVSGTGSVLSDEAATLPRSALAVSRSRAPART